MQSASSSNVIVGKEYLTTIEERLKIAEENISDLQAYQRRSRRQLRFDDEDVTEAINSGATRRASSIQENGVLDAGSAEAQNLVTLEDETDDIGGVIFSVEEDSGFFGDCSLLNYFITNICQAPHPISPLTVMYPVPWLIFLKSTSIGLTPTIAIDCNQRLVS